MQEIMNNVLLAAGILAPIITIILQAVKQLEAVNNKYLPIISMAFGIAVGLLIAYLYGQNIADYAIGGFLAGASASGLYDALTVHKQ